MDNSFRTVIKPQTGWFDINIRELFSYRDLIFLLVKRNYSTRYKQTILGPAWLVLSPLINTIISTIVFGKIAKIPSDGIPYFLFFLCGSSLWNYFATSLSNISSTFTANTSVFGKVYFPRLAIPISTVITGILDFAVQFILFLGFMLYFNLIGAHIRPNLYMLLIPLVLFQMSFLALGCGIIISSLTTKYRDLTVLVGFGINLWMYITPVIYSTNSLPEQFQTLCLLNPVAPIIEVFRYACLGTGEISFFYWFLSVAVTCIVLFIGVIIFSHVEKDFMDTV